MSPRRLPVISPDSMPRIRAELQSAVHAYLQLRLLGLDHSVLVAHGGGEDGDQLARVVPGAHPAQAAPVAREM